MKLLHRPVHHGIENEILHQLVHPGAYQFFPLYPVYFLKVAS